MSITSCNLKKFDFCKIEVIEILNEAISLIKDDEYLKVPYNRVKRGSQKPERVFVAELYHQLRCIQESNKHPFLKDLKFNVEINKQGDLITEIPLIDSYKINRVIPDIILHFKQNNTAKQMMVCEVKSSYSINQGNIVKDMIKLLVYKKSRLSYKHACFIFLGTKNELCKYLLALNGDLLKYIVNQIIFITRDDKKWNFYECKQLQ